MSAKKTYTTKQVAEEIDLTYGALTGLMNRGAIEPPAKEGRTYSWTNDDLRRARAYVRSRPKTRKAITA